jgi:hypothetical protein
MAVESITRLWNRLRYPELNWGERAQLQIESALSTGVESVDIVYPFRWKGKMRKDVYELSLSGPQNLREGLDQLKIANSQQDPNEVMKALTLLTLGSRIVSEG